MRSGAQTLKLLASPTNGVILKTLAEGPKRQADLRRAAGSPAQTTLRAQLRKLSEIGAIKRERRSSFPGVVEHKLTPAGLDLLMVLETVERWLRRAPEGPIELGGSEAKAAIKALTEGWSTAMLRALAAKPLTLTELDSIIASLNYPSLERRLTAMRLAGQVEQAQSNGRGTPYKVTEWTRQSIAPLSAAARWERLHAAERTAPVSKLDVEGAFLLTLPLLRPPAELSGACRLAVSMTNGDDHRLAGVLVEIERGRIASCTTRLDGHPEAWISGPTPAWFGAVIDRDTGPLEIGGDGQLARALIDGLHDVLFRLGAKRASP